jgi:lipoprotein-anchoring transpeptidase ErfK/SrfK
MYLKVGDIVIREFPISTGTWRTPTPYGNTQIYYKQEVRVGAKWPHYIMPKWMNFRHGGYGIHALPSIQYGNGWFWREALNHIGTRRSHGCIRLLPADAEFAYEWTPVGTAVWVHG